MAVVRPPTPAWLFDLSRWLWEESLRESLPPENPEVMRALSALLWRMGAWSKPNRKAVMVEEIRRCFGLDTSAAESISKEAHDSTLQARIEMLLSPRITDFSPYILMEGDFPEGALLFHPSVAAVPLLRAALARRWPGVVVFRARGLPRRGMGPWRDTAINRYALQRRNEEEEALPILWEENPDKLESHLKEGRRVIAAFDDRFFSDFKPVPFLGRSALISRAPWAAALAAQAPICTALAARERDRRVRALIRPLPSGQGLEAWLSTQLEPWLRDHPSTYAMWLAECRVRVGTDDHPFFSDYADMPPKQVI